MSVKIKQEPVAHVRPSPEVREALKQAAMRNGRTLTKEMEFRLAASVAGDHVPADLYAGYPLPDQMRFRSLGNVAGLIAANVLLMWGSNPSSLELLSDIRAAIMAFFSAQGVPDAPAKNQKFFATVGHVLADQIAIAANIDKPTGDKLALKEFAAAWGLHQSKDGKAGARSNLTMKE